MKINHISFNNTWMRFKHRAPISKVIQSDEHSNWDKSYYDFMDYLGRYEHFSFKAHYPIMLTPRRK